jgi:hypothetical protein
MSDNRRKSSRLRPPQERLSEPAVLHIGGVKLPARVENISAGGFGIVLEGRHDIEHNLRAVLQFDGDWFDVLVVRIEAQRGSTSLGLELGEDLIRPDDLRAVRPRLSSLFPAIPVAVIRGMGWTGFVVALLLAAAIWTGKTVILSARFPMPQVSGQSVTSTSQASQAAAPTKVARPPQKAYTQYTAAARELFDVNFQAHTDAEKLALGKLEYVAAVADDRVAKSLKLSAEQRLLVARLQQAGQEKLRLLPEASMVTDEALTTIQDLHDAVRSVLNARQRAQLEQLLRESRN